MEILLGGLDGQVQRLHSLSPGNWRMARHAPGGKVYLYDPTEGAGIACYDRTSLLWSVKVTDVAKVFTAGSRLLWIGQKRFGSGSLDGAPHFERDAIRGDDYRWTTAAGLPDGDILLGGYRLGSHAFALARLTRDGELSETIMEHPLQAVFPANVIEGAFEDECCGVDIHEVARIHPLDDGTLVVGLGGGGETLGACSGASALGLVTLTNGQWTTQVVDTHDGISGMLQLQDGRLLVDFCGQLRFYEVRR